MGQDEISDVETQMICIRALSRGMGSVRTPTDLQFSRQPLRSSTAQENSANLGMLCGSGHYVLLDPPNPQEPLQRHLFDVPMVCELSIIS